MGTHPIFESDFDCLTDCQFSRMDYPSNGVWNFDGIEIDSSFESGNLASVEFNGNAVSEEDAIDRRQGRRPIPDLEFRCHVAPDMFKTAFENRNSSWFHFRVRGAQGKCIRFNMMNLNRHAKLFNQGMAPVWMAHDKSEILPNILINPEKWQRVQSVFSHQANGQFILSFWQKITTNDDIYFSFTYPCSLRDQTEYLDGLEKKHKIPDARTPRSSDIYFHRELLCQTIEGRKVELVTISSYDGISDEREPSFAHNLPPPLPSRADNGEGEGAHDPGPGKITDQNRTARKFSGKRVYIISSRVHPGETPASHVLRGMIDFILRKNDKRSDSLRRNFVFKIIPIINPDGVARGHYRTDARGQNLNRFYRNPNQGTEPQCYAYRQLVWYCHNNYRLPHAPEAAKMPAGDAEEVFEDIHSGVAFLIDLHAHAAKRGAFLFGNRLKSSELQSELHLYARLASANSAHLDFDGCCFSQKNMTWKDKRDNGMSKEGSARVAFYYMIGAPHIYTLECNYNTGRYMNAISGGRSGAVTPPRNTIPLVKYTPDEYAEVGRGLLCASLDTIGANPVSRIAPNQVKALRGQIQRQVHHQRNEKFKSKKITTKSTTTALGTFDRLTISQKTSRSMSSSSISVDQKIDEQRNSRKYSGISRPSKFSHVKTHEKPLQGAKSASNFILRKKPLSKLPRLKPKETEKIRPQITTQINLEMRLPCKAE